eukprot:SAG11_NODE_552_length_8583_cov_3.699081_6_plen_66_part_00
MAMAVGSSYEKLLGKVVATTLEGAIEDATNTDGAGVLGARGAASGEGAAVAELTSANCSSHSMAE